MAFGIFDEYYELYTLETNADFDEWDEWFVDKEEPYDDNDDGGSDSRMANLPAYPTAD